MESIVQWRVALRFGAWRRVLVSRRAALGVVFAFGAAAVLVGCGREVPQSSPAAALNGVEPVRAEMARIEAAFNAAPSAAPADREALEALLARFEPQFDVSAERFESESVEGVALTLPGQPDLGVRFETLRAWGVDADAVDTPLAARIEATGVAYFGWETLLDDVNKAYIDGLADAVGNDENAAAQEALAVATPMVEEFSLTGARLVVDGFILHAEENSAGTIAPAVDEMADLVHDVSTRQSRLFHR